MPRISVEFHCPVSGGGCGKYFDFRLNTSLNGGYRIHCPNCGHVHYRTVTDGVITETRFTNSDDRDSVFLYEDIVPMRSSCRDTSKETHNDHARTGAGFLHRFWKEVTGA